MPLGASLAASYSGLGPLGHSPEAASSAAGAHEGLCHAGLGDCPPIAFPSGRRGRTWELLAATSSVSHGGARSRSSAFLSDAGSAAATSFGGKSAATEADPDAEGDAKALAGAVGLQERMLIEATTPPERGSMDEVGNNCRLDIHNETFGGSAPVTGRQIGPMLTKVTKCTEAAGDVVLHQLFGNLKAEPAGGEAAASGPGVKLVHSTPVNLGTAERAHFQAAQDACYDFAGGILHHFPQSGPRVEVEGASGGRDPAAAAAEFAPADVEHTLRSYGRCVDAIGEAATTEGCLLGRLGGAGGKIQKLCEEVAGPQEKACVIS